MENKISKKQIDRLIQENIDDLALQEGIYGSTKGFFKGLGGAFKNGWRHMMESRRLGSDIEDLKNAITVVKKMRSIVGRQIGNKVLEAMNSGLNELERAYQSQRNSNFRGREQFYRDNNFSNQERSYDRTNDSNQYRDDSRMNNSNQDRDEDLVGSLRDVFGNNNQTNQNTNANSEIKDGIKPEDEEKKQNQIQDIYDALKVLGINGSEKSIKSEIEDMINKNPNDETQEIIKKILRNRKI
jgi:hypothetical protein